VETHDVGFSPHRSSPARAERCGRRPPEGVVVVLVYKLAPPLRMRYELVLSLALATFGVAYLKMA
jgi:hypothetical protein